MSTYFELFSLTHTFDLDLEALELAYQNQVARFHPDKFTTADKSAQVLALQNTALLNTAFEALQSPLKRATYLLELRGIDAFDAHDTQMDAHFLMEQIELRERLETIQAQQDESALDTLIANISHKIGANVAQISAAFSDASAQPDALPTIKNLVRELKFYEQLATESSHLMDEWL